ncbi:MAG: hypothetical protein ABTQ31_12280 [Rhizobiaceae bacterium]
MELRCRVEDGTQALAADFASLAVEAGWHVQACDLCAGGCFPPRLRCPHCGSAKLRWTPVGEAATLVGVILVKGENPRHRPARALRRPEGYASGIVALDRWPDVRFPVLIEGEDAAIAEVGMRVRLGSTTVGSRQVPSGRPVPVR